VIINLEDTMSRQKGTDAAIARPDLVGHNEGREIDAKAERGQMMLTAEGLLRDMLEGGVADAFTALGRIQAATVSATVADTMLAQTYINLQKTGCYKGIPYRKPDGSAETVSTLDEFCEAFLGKTARRLRQLASNLHLLGEEMYEAAEAAGFRQRDYNALKALPADDQEAVRLALASDDKDKAIEVLSDLVTRQAAQKDQAQREAQAARKERDDTRSDYEAAAKLLGEAKSKVRRYEAGTLAPPAMDVQMADWPRATGYITGEIRANLTRIGLMIASCEREILRIAPQDDSPEADMVERACRTWYDAASADLQRLNEEVLGVLNHMDRVVGSFAYPKAFDASVQ